MTEVWLAGDRKRVILFYGNPPSITLLYVHDTQIVSGTYTIGENISDKADCDAGPNELLSVSLLLLPRKETNMATP